jgi:hypothetical protein
LADEDDVAGHVAALRAELAKWRGREREPALISRRWGNRLHERALAKRVVVLLENKANIKR